jgi:hypothetical protein
MKSFHRFTVSSLALILTASQLLAQQFTVLHNFTNSPDGKYPEAGLTLSGNTLYGTSASFGGSGGLGGGTLFKINTDGTGFTLLKVFVNNINAPDGTTPVAGLVLSAAVTFHHD